VRKAQNAFIPNTKGVVQAATILIKQKLKIKIMFIISLLFNILGKKSIENPSLP
jgi:hypothetical protein